jgi:hypothetical protein
MQRPTGITVTTILMALKIAVGLVIIFFKPPWIAANLHPHGHVTMASAIFTMRLIFIVVLPVACVIVWCYWLGQFWARRVVLLGCLFYLYEIVHLKASWNYSHLRAVMTIYGAILAAFMLFYLFTREAKAWFPWPASAARYR